MTTAPVVEKHLVIEKTSQKLLMQGKSAGIITENLGLGKLATKDVIAANDTSTLPVADKNLQAGMDLNAIIEPGEYFHNVTSNATLALNYPEAVASALKVYLNRC